MFYSLIKRNSRADRKENSLYFISMIIAIVAFYVILSLENQDAVRFIRHMESDAIQKLMTLVPMLYVFSLFVISFLVFFTTRYQLERRNHEFGLYLMMGMKRSRLFFMLIAEDMVNTILSLLIGIPAAVLLSEIISLTVSRLMGIGILGHEFRVSFSAVLWTVGGLLAVKLLVLGILSGITVGKEPGSLMKPDFEEREKKKGKKASLSAFWLAVCLLAAAYAMGACRLAWEYLYLVPVTIICGMAGTFLLFEGFYPFFEKVMEKQKEKTGLTAFTFRQLQESVFLKNGSLASCSLLALISFCCLAFGISAALAEKPEHIMDYTFTGEEKEIKEKLEQSGIMEELEAFYEIRTGTLDTSAIIDGQKTEGEHTFDYEELMDAIKKRGESEARDILLNNLGGMYYPYLINLSGYNQLLLAAGEKPVTLAENEIMFLGNSQFTMNGMKEILQEVLKENIHLQIDDKTYTLKNEMKEYNIVTDSSITLSYAFIVNDSLFSQLIQEKHCSSYWNAVLRKDLVRKEGLIQSISAVNSRLNQTGLEYESYMQNIGRHLFYIIAESYVFVYLGVIFLIIANTAVGTQFLMHQKKTGRRYQTLLALGSTFKELSKSSRTQIRWYFLLPVLTALLIAVFGMKAMTNGLLSNFFQPQKSNMLLLAMAVLLVICVVEYLYMTGVMKSADRNIRLLMKRKRDE